MSYFLRSNLTVIRRNLSTYLPTMLFLTAGMTVLFAVLCGVFSFYDDMNDRLGNIKGMDFTVQNDWYLYNEAAPYSHAEFKPVFIDNVLQRSAHSVDKNAFLMLSDFDLIKERLGDRVSVKASYMMEFSLRIENGRWEYDVIFLSDDYFEPFRAQVDGEFIMTSRSMLDFIIDASTPGSVDFGIMNRFPFLYEPERGVFLDTIRNTEVKVLLFEDAENTERFDVSPLIRDTAVGADKEPKWHKYVFIPFKYLYDIYQPKDSDLMRLRISAEEINDLYESLSILNMNHEGRISYTFDETSEKFLRAVSEQVEMIAVVIPMTLLVMLVIGMNFMGLQLMSVRRRQRDIAIQMTCGAGRAHIYGGVVLLVLLTVTAAALLAVVLGAIAVHVLEIRLYNVFVTVKWLAALPVLGFGWLIGVLSCLPTMLRLSRLSPVDILVVSVA